MNRSKTIGLALLSLIALSGILFSSYIFVQQSYRQNANDPQVQLTEDIARILSQGRDPEDVIPPQSQTEMTSGLQAFAIIYDESGKILASSVVLDGKPPVAPKAALNMAKNLPDNRITWEPKKGVKVAAVIKHFGGPKPGYILAGRSLREVESRIRILTNQFVIAEISLVVLWLIAVLLILKKPKGDEGSPGDGDIVEVTEVVMAEVVEDSKEEKAEEKK